MLPSRKTVNARVRRCKTSSVESAILLPDESGEKMKTAAPLNVAGGGQSALVVAGA